MRRASHVWIVLTVALVTAMFTASAGATAQKDGKKRQHDGDTIVDSAAEVYTNAAISPDSAHHDGSDDHLPPQQHNVTLVGEKQLTDIPGRVADVAYGKKHAYLAAWSAGLPSPQCTGGAWVVDMSRPANPRKVNFLPAARNSYYTEGMQVLTNVNTPSFQGDLLLASVESCGDNVPGTGGGLDIWDVTDPTKTRLLSRGIAGDYSVGDTEVPPDEPWPHQAHSVFGWQYGGKVIAALIDNEELLDVDIFDISNPAAPVKLSETGDSEWPAVEVDGYGDAAFSHDFTAKNINGTMHLMVSYWDAGWVDLNVSNPANPVFINDSNYADCDQVIGPPACPPEGNAHQNEWNRPGGRFIGTDEDFATYRLDFALTSGPHAGTYPAGEFSWTVPIVSLPDKKMNGPTVFGGYGCPEDRPNIPTAANNGVTAGEGEEEILVLQRGPVQDPNHPGEACFFSEKVETAQLLGYGGAIVANHHAGSGAGAQPDAFLCGSQGHEFTPTIPGVCVGHRAMHLMFDTGSEPQTYPPDYTLPYPVGDPGDVEPDVGDIGADVAATAQFDGWGYARYHNANTMVELDQYAIPAVSAENLAFGHGNLTVHEVAVEKAKALRRVAYFSWYAGGFRVAVFDSDSIQQKGVFIDQEGSDFWGVELCGFDAKGRRLICGSDRDFGLQIFRYTGPTHL